MGRCRGRRPKASEERTRGKRRVVLRIWGFCRAAAPARHDFGRSAESGTLLVIANWPPPLSEDRTMPTIDFLRTRFAYGYDSGNVLSIIPNFKSLIEELRIGGSYRRVFIQAVLPYLRPHARVLELGPGRGSWSR